MLPIDFKAVTRTFCREIVSQCRMIGNQKMVLFKVFFDPRQCNRGDLIGGPIPIHTNGAGCECQLVAHEMCGFSKAVEVSRYKRQTGG